MSHVLLTRSQVVCRKVYDRAAHCLADKMGDLAGLAERTSELLDILHHGTGLTSFDVGDANYTLAKVTADRRAEQHYQRAMQAFANCSEFDNEHVRTRIRFLQHLLQRRDDEARTLGQLPPGRAPPDMIDERVEVLMRDLDKLDTMLPRTEVQA